MGCCKISKFPAVKSDHRSCSKALLFGQFRMSPEFTKIKKERNIQRFSALDVVCLVKDN